MEWRSGRRCRSGQPGVAAVDDDGEILRRQAVLRKQRSGLGRTKLEKLVRLRRPREEITQPVMLWLVAATDDLYRRTNRAHYAVRLIISRST